MSEESTKENTEPTRRKAKRKNPKKRKAKRAKYGKSQDEYNKFRRSEEHKLSATYQNQLAMKRARYKKNLKRAFKGAIAV